MSDDGRTPASPHDDSVSAPGPAAGHPDANKRIEPDEEMVQTSVNALRVHRDGAEAPGASATSGSRAAGSHPDAEHHQHPFTRSLLWTAGGTLVPGLGLLPTRLWRLGVALMALLVAFAVVMAWQLHSNLGGLAAMAMRPRWLTGIAVAMLVLALLWVVLIVGTHLLTRPRHLSTGQRAIGAAVVGLLSLLVSAPFAVATSYAFDQRDLVNGIFKDTADSRSGTRPTNVGTGSHPWANKPRLNILLLGGDSSVVRDKEDPTEGIRTDTVMMASIDTSNGNTVLIQLPRNMETFHFPKDSDLDRAYPNGYWDGKDNENAEFELNSVWENVPKAHPELFKNTDYPNADAVKYAVEGITGLKPDYFALLNIDGLQKVIDAMGGVRVNVNERIPMGQSQEQAKAGLSPSGGWLNPGANQLLNGYKAMWYARSRSQSSDGDRMARQSCVVNAIIDQANPQNLITHYESIADAGKNAVLTDIPQEVIPAITQLALTMKNGRVHRLLFAYNSITKKGTDLPGGGMFKPWAPDTAAMAQLIQQTIDGSEGISTPSATPSATASATQSSTVAGQAPSTTAAIPSSTQTTSRPQTTSSAAKPSAATTANYQPNADLSDACSYHPQS